MKPQARMMLPAAPSTTTRPTTTSKAASMSHGHAEFLRTVTTTSRIGRLPRVGSLRRPYTDPMCGCNRVLLRGTRGTARLTRSTAALIRKRPGGGSGSSTEPWEEPCQICSSTAPADADRQRRCRDFSRVTRRATRPALPSRSARCRGDHRRHARRRRRPTRPPAARPDRDPLASRAARPRSTRPVTSSGDGSSFVTRSSRPEHPGAHPRHSRRSVRLLPGAACTGGSRWSLAGLSGSLEAPALVFLECRGP